MKLLGPVAQRLRRGGEGLMGVAAGAGVDDPQIGGAVGAIQTDNQVERVWSLHATSFRDGIGLGCARRLDPATTI